MERERRNCRKPTRGWGYRKIWTVLRREGWGVNRKRVHRLWQQHGLQVPRRGRRVRKTGPRGPVTRAAYRNHVWSVDFVFDQTMDARPLKCLTVVDPIVISLLG